MWRASIAAAPRSSVLTAVGPVRAAVAVGVTAGAALAASTSAFVIRPAGPLPWTAAMSTPSAAATRRATGETWAPLPSACCAGSGAAAVAGAERAAAAPLPSCAPSCGRRRPITRPTATVSPARGEDLGDRAADGRGQLHVDLVRRQLDDRLALLDAVADRDCPLEDRALLDGFAAGGRDDVDELGLPRRVLVGRRLGCRLGGGKIGGDLGEHAADRDRLAGGGVDLHERAGGRRGDLGIDLVGRYLDERLVGLDGVALLLVPLENGSLAHRLAHRRKPHLNCRVHGHPDGQL